MVPPLFPRFSPLSEYDWKYANPIFDAHTHTWDGYTDEMVEVDDALGVKGQLLIVHQRDIRDRLATKFPGRFVFTKYLSMRSVFAYRVEEVVQEIEDMAEDGFSIAKMWFAPRARDFVGAKAEQINLRNPRLEPVFEKLEEAGHPLLIHVGDPDTFFATAYQDADIYGTKDEHLDQLEYLIQRYSGVKFQLAHFGAQPEIHRLPRLASWFEKYPNFVVDTASSRWMARELSKDPQQARAFLMKYSNRILFGTDGIFRESSKPGEQSPYFVRVLAQRILWETDKRDIPLPFPDADTEATGGTFINGLDLPMKVLKDIYWGNAHRLYGSMIA
jgi:predicted TIM-barrel fold metal-dependent hydrolase